jgi:hypothetical protein
MIRHMTLEGILEEAQDGYRRGRSERRSSRHVRGADRRALASMTVSRAVSGRRG